MISDKLFIKVISDLQIITLLLCTKYPDDEQMIDDYLDGMDLHLDNDLNLIGYIKTLMAFAINKEEYEHCSTLKLLLKKITND